jgi:hypothetical protein
VPNIENSAVFDDIGNSCPWQSAQFIGAKFAANPLISPIVPSMSFDFFNVIFR